MYSWASKIEQKTEEVTHTFEYGSKKGKFTNTRTNKSDLNAYSGSIFDSWG